jgi:NhaP-type Na+/H+ or K+/H+ antiporter
MTTEPTEPRAKEWRIARDVRMALQLGREPAKIVPTLRRWLVRLWASKGGGYYGLGYVVTFVVLEVKSLAGDMTSVAGIESQAVQYILRFSIDSFLNILFALLWPIRVLEWLGGWGLLVLAAGYAAFDFAIRPVVEAWLPDVKEAVAERERLKQEKKEAKRLKRAARRSQRE